MPTVINHVDMCLAAERGARGPCTRKERSFMKHNWTRLNCRDEATNNLETRTLSMTGV